eukprot:3539228-Amphidinium_carterae.1
MNIVGTVILTRGEEEVNPFRCLQAAFHRKFSSQHFRPSCTHAFEALCRITATTHIPRLGRRYRKGKAQVHKLPTMSHRVIVASRSNPLESDSFSSRAKCLNEAHCNYRHIVELTDLNSV